MVDQDVEGRAVLKLLNIVTSIQELILDLEEDEEEEEEEEEKEKIINFKKR
jgi:hypothetical protein